MGYAPPLAIHYTPSNIPKNKSSHEENFFFSMTLPQLMATPRIYHEQANQ
jgi:hypothetical protein